MVRGVQCCVAAGRSSPRPGLRKGVGLCRVGVGFRTGAGTDRAGRGESGSAAFPEPYVGPDVAVQAGCVGCVGLCSLFSPKDLRDLAISPSVQAKSA